MINLLAATDGGGGGGGTGKGPGTLDNPLLNGLLGGSVIGSSTASYIAKFIQGLILFALSAGVIIFLFMLLTGGIQWISAGGDKQALENARTKMSNALIGIVIMFATFAVIQLIEYFFGITILTIDIKPLVIQ